MKNKKLITVCIVAILFIVIGLGLGLNIAATKKYESAMKLIEEYTSSFETQEEVDEMEHIYDKFLADEKLSSYYGKNDAFDECYDLAKEEMERTIQKEKDKLAEEVKQEVIEDKSEEVTVESNNEVEEKEEKEEVNTPSNSNNSTNNQFTQPATTDNNNNSNNNADSQASNSSTSTETTTTTTSSKYDYVRNDGTVFKCPSEIAKLAPSKGYWHMFMDEYTMYWCTNDFDDNADIPPSYSCIAGPDGIPIPGTIYRGNDLIG